MARLGKVSQELNTGMDRIVEFLQKKGVQIENNPSAKISEEDYKLLQEEFSDGASEKAEAKKIDLSETRMPKGKVELKTEEPAPVQPKVEEIKIEAPELKGPKIVGTIPTIKKPAKKVVKEQKPEPKVEKSAPKVEEKPKVEIKEKVEPKQPEVKAEPTVEKTVAPETPQAPVEEEIFTLSRAKVENNIKILDKIDLDSINSKTHPDKKTRKEKEQERKERQQQQLLAKQNAQARRQEKEKQESENKRSNESNFIKTEVPTLKGPQIVDKMELDSDSRSGSKKDKKKRDRIKGQKVKTDGTEDYNSKKDASRDKFGKWKNGKRVIYDAVDDEEVEDNIKNVRRELAGMGRKTSTSKHRRDKREEIRQEMELAELEQQEQEKILKVTDVVSANDLSAMMNIPVLDIIKACFDIGLMVTQNQRLEADTIQMIAENFGYEVQFVSADIQESIEEVEDKPEDLLPRPPIVTVMGHVDHGKTSLLDYIRKSNVIAGEAGGITQHIGAYHVTLPNGRQITFLDTPGHEAFTAMRARGAQVTDIAIIVVAADDNVMPQTVEAINHAAAAGVPIVFAINKIDKPGANPDKVREQLANMNYVVEEWGGKYQCQEIAAKFGKNVDLLMEKVLLEADLLELKANPNKPAQGTVIESKLDKGRGYTTNVLISSGTLHVGDVILAGMHAGKIKAMFNEREQRIEEAGPSTPVMILGLDGAPQAGDKIHVMGSEREARDIASKRERLQREQELRAMKPETLEDIARKIKIGNVQELNLIVKGDVGGSIEALSDSLLKLSTEEIQVVIKHKAVGQEFFKVFGQGRLKLQVLTRLRMNKTEFVRVQALPV